MFVYCTGADIYPLVNNNMLTNNAAVVAKILVKSICLGVQLQHSRHIEIMLITQATGLGDVINLAWRNKFINTYPEAY